jgi:hypothetical protein
VFRRGEILPAGLCSWAKNLKVVRGERRRDGRQDSGNGDFLNHDGIHSKVEALALLVIGAKTGQGKPVSPTTLLARLLERAIANPISGRAPGRIQNLTDRRK